MRRAIVHIGMPRTGSTSIQQILARRRDGLRESGLLYPELAPPEAGPAANVNHQWLGEALDGRRSAAERTATLARLSRALAFTDADTVVLSYEDFAVQRHGLGIPEVLRDVFARHGFAMEVVLVVKSQSEQFNSAYALRTQLAREHGTFRDYLRRQAGSRRYDYAARLQPWSDACDGRVVAVPLRHARSTETLLVRFLVELGLGSCLPLLAHGDESFVTNRSSGPYAVEASRRLCASGLHRQAVGHPRQIGHVLDGIAQTLGLDAERFWGCPPEIVRDIDARFAPANERFARMVWGKSWNDVVAPAALRPSNELAMRERDPMVEACIGELVAGTVEHFRWRELPAWRRLPENLIERCVESVSGVVGYPRWRVP